MDKIDVTIIGAGIVGLAVAAEAASKAGSVFIIEKNPSFGQEASSRNSEVIHAGIYYPYGSDKHILCCEGREMVYSICRKSSIDFSQCGKFIVAPGNREMEEIHSLYINARKNDVPGVELVSPYHVAGREPDVRCAGALFSPRSGIVDSHRLMEYFLHTAIEKGAEAVYRSEVIKIEQVPGQGFLLGVKNASGEVFEYISERVVNCAGLCSDSVAATAGIDVDKEGYRLHYSKGSYFRLERNAGYGVKSLVYPAVKKHSSTLGIHLTPDLGGGLRLGPDSRVLEGREFDYKVDESEKEKFAGAVKGFFPRIRQEDIYPDTAGVRASLKNNDGFSDFIISDEKERGLEGLINLVGIDSPGLTASPAIGLRVGKMLR